MLLLILLLCINVGIAYFNARFCGMAWLETKALGGWGRVIVWCGAIQSVIGFSSAYAFIAALIVGGKAGAVVMALWYWMIIIPAVGTGLLIMIISWINAYRNRDFGSMAEAAWNTFASAHNISGMSSGLSATGDVISGFFEGDSDDALPKLALVALAIFVLGVSIGTTYMIIQHYKGALPLPERDAVTA